jgi:two-component system, cell cycle sensor histidine kinase and response regulator CckA
MNHFLRTSGIVRAATRGLSAAAHTAAVGWALHSDPADEHGFQSFLSSEMGKNACGETEVDLKKSGEEAWRLAQVTAVMAEIGRIISSAFDTGEVYERFTEETREIIPFDRIAISLVDAGRRTHTVVHVSGIPLPCLQPGDTISLEDSVAGEIIRTGKGVLLHVEDSRDWASYPSAMWPAFEVGLRSTISVPLISKDEVIGILYLHSLQSARYTDLDLKLAENLGALMAGGIANARLFAERKKAEEEKTSLEEQLRQSQKMEAIGRLAGGIAHDFNNLLTVINGYSQLCLDHVKEEGPAREHLAQIQKAVERASGLTHQLLAFSRRQIMEMKVLDLGDLLREVDRILRRVIGEDISLVTVYGKDLGSVKADPSQIEQVILNLAVNARDAMPKGGKLLVEVENIELDDRYVRLHVGAKEGRYVMLSISDSGIGMSREIMERIFEPFFTTKEKGKGTGLGLSTVYGIVKQSGGNIWVYSEPGQGTTFKIYFPRVDNAEDLPEIEAGNEEAGDGGSETILVVEDDKEVRQLVVECLELQGYAVFQASHWAEAIGLCERVREPIHLVLSDVVLPEISGPQMIDRLLKIRRDFAVLFMSGYTDTSIVNHGALDEGMKFLQKPFTFRKLAGKVREALDEHRQRSESSAWTQPHLNLLGKPRKSS